MKRPLVLALTFGFAASLSAQTVQFVIVSKSHDYVQDSASLPTTESTTPWGIGSYVIGSGLTNSAPINSASFLAGGGGTVNNGALAFQVSDAEWRAEYFYATQTALDGAFADGNYNVSLNSYLTPWLNLSSSLYPNTPSWSVTSGSAGWNSGFLVVDPTQTLVLTSNVFSTNFSSGSTRIGWDISGPGYNDSSGNGDFSSTSVSVTIPAFSLTSGSTYDLSLEFNRFSGQTPLSSTGITGLDGANFVTMLGTATNLQILAVPEPATFALLAGLGALVGVAWRRRSKARR